MKFFQAHFRKAQYLEHVPKTNGQKETGNHDKHDLTHQRRKLQNNSSFLPGQGEASSPHDHCKERNREILKL